jgi:hypothetical protein
MTAADRQLALTEFHCLARHRDPFDRCASGGLCAQQTARQQQADREFAAVRRELATQLQRLTEGR